MDGQGSSLQSVATQHRVDRREQRPLPPYPGNSQHIDGDFHVDPRDAELYQRLVTGAQEGVNDTSREYEQWRESGYQGSPRSYSRGNGDFNTSSSSLPGQAISAPVQVSRSRGSSASQRIGEKRAQASEAVNEMRANRPFRIDGPSNPRRTSSTSARGSTSSMSAHQSDGSSSGGDAPLLSQTSPGQNRRRRVAEATEVVVPRWQPDVEVTFCPICRTQFSFFVRKHHCRKCGRVVCNSCSPHRITIPYQYIVQPPIEGVSTGPQSGFPRPTIDSARAGSSREVASLGGGERVRLCNPCVPDPNIAPPQPSLNDPPQLFPSPNRSSRSASAASYSYSQYQQQHSTSRPTSNVEAFNEAIRSAPRRPRESSLLGPTNPQYASYRDQTISSRGLEGYDTRSRSSTVSGTSRDTGNMGNGQSTVMQAGTQAQASSGQSPNSLGRVAQSSAYPRSTNQMSSQQPHPKPQRATATAPVPQPRPQIADDDMCWICREELPARNLPNFQNLRDQHVNNCVARETSRAAGSQGAAGPADPLAQHRNGQLFPYIATEKDCVDDAECTICLEDFEVGVEMGRLECFCRYHKKCIRKWWEKKPGECPVHHAPT